MAEERYKTFTKKRVALCAAVVLFAAVIGLLVANHDSTPMPVYQGKTAREWMYSRSLNFGSARIDAFHEMGSNAVPFLVHELARKNSVSESFKEWLYPKLPQGISKHFSPPMSAGFRLMIAASCLIEVDSRSAIPPLRRLVTEGNAAQQFFALFALAELVKPEDTNLIPELKICLNSKEPSVCVAAAGILDHLHSGEIAIPTLTNVLAGTNVSESMNAWKLLRKIEPTNAARWDVMLTNSPAFPAISGISPTNDVNRR